MASSVATPPVLSSSTGGASFEGRQTLSTARGNTDRRLWSWPGVVRQVAHPTVMVLSVTTRRQTLRPCLLPRRRLWQATRRHRLGQVYLLRQVCAHHTATSLKVQPRQQRRWQQTSAALVRQRLQRDDGPVPDLGPC